jgi:hypothetical protein
MTTASAPASEAKSKCSGVDTSKSTARGMLASDRTRETILEREASRESGEEELVAPIWDLGCKSIYNTRKIETDLVDNVDEAVSYGSQKFYPGQGSRCSNARNI